MPCYQPSPLDTTVSACLFFKLPPELRKIIYKCLLTRQERLDVPGDFLERQIAREGTDSNLFMQIPHGKRDPQRKGRGRFGRKGPPKPLAIAIIYTCRLVSTEAIPILYSCNTIRFSTSRVAYNFRWTTAVGKGHYIRELSIKSQRSDKIQEAHWLEYISRKSFSLGHDFPNLKRLRIDTDWSFRQSDMAMLAAVSQHIRGLDWLHLSSLKSTTNDRQLLEWVGPTVAKPGHTGYSTRNIIMEITQHEIPKLGRLGFGIWKSATIWMGTYDAKCPLKVERVSILDRIVGLYRLEADNKSCSDSLILYDWVKRPLWQ